uniref:Uncharacterized protein n=1 Tax=Anguilla anguilla TaxID=7936 RepID=A0A0E9U2A4_ANGAN
MKGLKSPLRSKAFNVHPPNGSKAPVLIHSPSCL